jgi:hypothetical protein
MGYLKKDCSRRERILDLSNKVLGGYKIQPFYANILG